MKPERDVEMKKKTAKRIGGRARKERGNTIYTRTTKM